MHFHPSKRPFVSGRVVWAAFRPSPVAGALLGLPAPRRLPIHLILRLRLLEFRGYVLLSALPFRRWLLPLLG